MSQSPDHPRAARPSLPDAVHKVHDVHPVHATRPRATRRTYLLAALIAGAALLAYAPALRAGFIWDDASFIIQNPLVRGADGLFRYWFTTTTPDYFPLDFNLLWFEWRLFGSNAAGYHLVNVLLHAAAAVLLWRALLRLRIPGAWLAGLLFAVHPVTVESVAWIEEHKSTLPIVLCLASILAWLSAEGGKQNAECRVQKAEWNGEPALPELLRAERAHSGEARSVFHSALRTLHSAFRTPVYVLSLALFLLALLAKTSVVFLPAILLMLAWWQRGRIVWRDVLRALPFAALAVALGLVTVWFQYHNAIGGDVVRTDSLAARTACAGWAAWFYLYKDLLPANLCFVYPRWTTSASLLAFLPGILLLALLALFARRRRTWGRAGLFALGYFLVALLPVLGFLNIYFMKYSLVADHWQYAALIGVVSLVAGLLGCAMERQNAWRPAAIGLSAALVLACGALTFRQARVYHNDESLWRDTLAKNPKAWLARSHLAGVLIEKARAPGADSAALLRQAEQYSQETVRDLDQAHEPRVCYVDEYVNRGIIRAAGRQYEAALRDFDQAIAIKPDDAQAYFNRALVRATVGRDADALADLDQAIALNPYYAQACVNHGNLQAAAGRSAQAIRDYGRAIALDPDYADAYFSRGTAYAQAGRLEEALRDLNRAIALQPGDAEAHCNRGNIRAASGRYREALADYTRAIELNPGYGAAYLNRAIAYYMVKDYPRAKSDLRAAERLGEHPPPDFLRALEAAAPPR